MTAQKRGYGVGTQGIIQQALLNISVALVIKRPHVRTQAV